MKALLSSSFWLVVLGCLSLAGCASVSSTSQFYLPYSTKVYPPKPADADIPILGRKPPEPNTAIGHLVFETNNGWSFLRKSMVYNAQIHGADAVVLKSVNTRKQVNYNEVPPRTDWMPMQSYYRGKNGQVCGYTTWVPYYQPGYIQRWEDEITGIDAEMIVLKK